MKINENKIKKITLLAAILAPMVYLFGSLFEALKGGASFTADYDIVVDGSSYTNNQLINPRSNTIGNVVIDSDGGLYSFTGVASSSGGRLRPLSTNVSLVEGHTYYFSTNVPSGFPGYFCLSYSTGNNVLYQNLHQGRETFVSLESGAFIFGMNTNPNNTFDYSDIFLNLIDLSLWYGGDIPSDYASTFQDYIAYDTGTYVYQPIYGNPDNAEYLFNQFFTKYNFLSESGRNVINGTPDYGFAPAADMIRYIDSNMLHLANLEWGYLVIGYVYYAFHVTIVFLMFELLMFFPHLIENIYDKFERGV